MNETVYVPPAIHAELRLLVGFHRFLASHSSAISRTAEQMSGAARKCRVSAAMIWMSVMLNTNLANHKVQMLFLVLKESHIRLLADAGDSKGSHGDNWNALKATWHLDVSKG